VRWHPSRSVLQDYNKVAAPLMRDRLGADIIWQVQERPDWQRRVWSAGCFSTFFTREASTTFGQTRLGTGKGLRGLLRRVEHQLERHAARIRRKLDAGDPD